MIARLRVLLVALVCALAARPSTLKAAGSQERSSLEEQEQRQCEAQMLRIHKGIVRFHADEKRLPDFLSDLWPNYCQKEDFICPAKDRVGDKIWVLPDPLQ